MPVTPFEIMTSKVWANGLVVLGVCAPSLAFVIQGLLRLPIEGSVALFLVGTALSLFATSSLGIFRQLVVLFTIGAVLFAYALARFRATIGTMV